MLYQLSYSRLKKYLIRTSFHPMYIGGGDRNRTYSDVVTRFTVWPGSPTPARPHFSPSNKIYEPYPSRLHLPVQANVNRPDILSFMPLSHSGLRIVTMELVKKTFVY